MKKRSHRMVATLVGILAVVSVARATSISYQGTLSDGDTPANVRPGPERSSYSPPSPRQPLGSAPYAIRSLSQEVAPQVPSELLSTESLDPNLATQIERAAYWFGSDGGGGYVADNPGHNLRSRFDETGLTATPQAASLRWELKLRTCAIDGVEIPACEPTAHKEVLTYNHRPGFVEWYDNLSGGVKQSFKVEQRRPGATGDLHLEIAVAKTGLTAEYGGSHIDFITTSGSLALRYDELVVFDALGERVPAEMEWRPESDRIVLVVHDASATYPLLVDPTIGKTRTIELALGDSNTGQNFGWAIATSGETLVVGAPGTFPTGAVYIFRRNESGGNAWGLVKKIEAPQGALKFGESVAIDGPYLAVGAPMSNLTELTQNGTNVLAGAGAAYVYRRYGGNSEPWEYVKQFIPANRAAGAHFGTAVAISEEAAVIGAPDHGSGRAFVFESSDSGVTWAQAAEIAGNGDPDAVKIGQDVDIDGDRAVLGAAHLTDPGVAYLHKRGDGTWPLGKVFVSPDNEAASQGFGKRVGVSGDHVAITSYQGIDTSGQGQVYIFKSTGGNSWSTPQILVGGSGNGFAWSIDLADGQLVIGRPENGNGGFVHLWVINGIWQGTASSVGGNQGYGYSVALGSGVLVTGGPFENNQVAQDTGAIRVSEVPVRPSSAITSTVSDSRFGTAIDVDKNRMVVAAPGNLLTPRAAAYVFERSGTDWQLLAKLDPPGSASEVDGFGSDVAIEGDTVLVGAPFTSHSGFQHAGAVYVYTQSHGSQGNWTSVRIDGSGQAGGNFGVSVDLWEDNALIGAPGIDVKRVIGGFPALFTGAGEVGIHRRDHGGVNQWGRYATLRATASFHSGGFGKAIDVDAGLCAIGAPGIGQSTAPEGVHVYEHTPISDSWEKSHFLSPYPGQQYGFGEAVSVSNPYVLIGAPFKDSGQTPDVGAAVLYETILGGEWLIKEFCPPSPLANAQFGVSVALEGTRSIVGSPGFTSSGRAYAFDAAHPNFTTGEWRLTELKLLGANSDSRQGAAVALWGGLALVGAPGNSSTGLVHQYERPLVNWNDWVRHHFPLIAGNPSHENLWGFTADPDGDSISNGLEWALCGDPLSFDPLDLKVEVNADGSVEISFICSSFRTEDHILSLMTSTDLEAWTVVGSRLLDDSWTGNSIYSPGSDGKTRVRFFDQTLAQRQWFRIRLLPVQVSWP